MSSHPHADFLLRENLRYFFFVVEFDESSGMIRSYFTVGGECKKPDPFFVSVMSVFRLADRQFP